MSILSQIEFLRKVRLAGFIALFLCIIVAILPLSEKTRFVAMQLGLVVILMEYAYVIGISLYHRHGFLLPATYGYRLPKSQVKGAHQHYLALVADYVVGALIFTSILGVIFGVQRGMTTSLFVVMYLIIPIAMLTVVLRVYLHFALRS